MKKARRYGMALITVIALTLFSLLWFRSQRPPPITGLVNQIRVGMTRAEVKFLLHDYPMEEALLLINWDDGRIGVTVRFDANTDCVDDKWTWVRDTLQFRLSTWLKKIGL
jgi:hypothetical protein